MEFQPNPNDVLNINGVPYCIAEHPAAPGIVYGQEGRAGIVYRLMAPSGNVDQALKVFKPRFRFPFLVGQAERISPFASLPGLSACRRTVLTPSRYPDLLRLYPDLIYAVLMPWIDGPTWQEVLLGKKPLSPQDSLFLARGLVEVLVRMEEQGIAHCDLSASNLMLPALSSDRVLRVRKGVLVELVDLESFYVPGMAKPQEVMSGSAGYAHRQAVGGVWGPEADRFAGAVLLAEILGFCDPEIVQAAWGESYFDPQEMQVDSSRYRLLVKSLGRNWGDRVVMLFERAWFSETLADCPTFRDWFVALPEEPPVARAVSSFAHLFTTMKAMPAPSFTEMTRAQVLALMRVANRLEKIGNLEGALTIYLEAQALAQSDPALASLAQEIELIAKGLEGQREAVKAIPVPLQATSSALPVTTPEPYLAEKHTVHRKGNWVWIVIMLVFAASLIAFTILSGWLIVRQQAQRLDQSTSMAIITPTPTFTSLPPSTFTPTPIPITSTPSKPTVVFREDFTGQTLNTSIWEVDIGSGNIEIKNGILALSSDGKRYPYLRTRRNPFPAGNFRVTFCFRYFQVRTCGVGVILASYIGPIGLSLEETTKFEKTFELSGLTTGVWQDDSYGMQIWSFRRSSQGYIFKQN